MAADIRADRRRALMAAALGRVGGGGMMSLVITDNDGRARMGAAIRDD
jgi:hypothetical protein